MSYCNWESRSELDAMYHDAEWGIPLHDDQIGGYIQCSRKEGENRKC